MADEYRVYNFSAGPSVLPEPVLRKCAAEMLNYEGTGESVMEMSHRSPEYQKIIDDAEANLRKLMNIPDDYYVLFLQGGGTLQFSMVPINLMTGSHKADYIVAGQWGKKAWEEARKFGDARCVASSEESVYTYIPKVTKEDIRALADSAVRVIPERVRYYAPMIGVTYGRITIRNQRTRWGSCSSIGNLNFNCLLMLTPVEIQDYVIVHELCHRIEMNHSKRFWQLVESAMPDYKARRKWLKDEGKYILMRAFQ